MASEQIGERRRRYSAELKAQVLAECEAPGASVAKVAMSHGINANVVHRWRQAGARGERSGACREPAASSFRWRSTAAVAAQRRARDIEVELRRGARDDDDHLAAVGGGRLRAPGCASCCGDPRRRGVAGGRAAGHALGHRSRRWPAWCTSSARPGRTMRTCSPTAEPTA